MSQMEHTLSSIKTKKSKGPATNFQTLREGEGNIDCTKTHGTPLNYSGKVTSFPKGQRFK